MSQLLPENDIKCRISEGCFFALGSFSKVKLEKVAGENDAGIDFRLIKQIKRNGTIRDLTGILDFQLKSTSNWVRNDTVIKYSLASKNYNDIVLRNIEDGPPLILIVMCLPQETNQWLSINLKSLKFNTHMFWYHTYSLEYLPNEKSTKTISIPVINSLNKSTFKSLISKYSLQAA